MDITRVKQFSDLAFEVCWAGIRWVISITLLILMAFEMANIVIKSFHQIGH